MQYICENLAFLCFLRLINLALMEKYKSLRIIFMGTPEFAVASLEGLVNGGCNIVGVVTAPDKPSGRGMKLQQSDVKKYAVEKGLNVLQPVKLKDPLFIKELGSLKADIQLVVAFRMLPDIVWDMPPMGTINLHGSLLPQYRGAAPINWAIINGEKETGVTTFKLKHEIDTGDILMQESFPIGPNETAGELHDRMMEIGAGLLLRTVKELAEGTLIPKPQPPIINRQSSIAALRTAPKIHTETCRIDWSQTLETVHNFIRGLSPYPAAFTILNEKMFKIFRGRKEPGFPAVSEGEYETDEKSFLKIACTDGYLQLLEVQMEGKKKMMIEEFLNGYRFN
jgi:methionyl-tRNA formyltransferase